jgi:hypothetical protein
MTRSVLYVSFRWHLRISRRQSQCVNNVDTYRAFADACCQRSISDPQQVLPLVKVSLEADALGNLKARNERTARFACPISRQFRMFADTPCGIDRGEKQIGRARQVLIEVG